MEIDSAVLNFSPTAMNIMNSILAILMLAVAIDLTRSDFTRVARHPKSVFVGMFSQFIAMPALTLLLVTLVKPHASMALGMIVVAACPGGNISNYITHRANGNTALGVTMTAIATVVAIAMTPFNIAFWGGLYEPSAVILREARVDPVTVAITVAILLVLPLAIGMALNHYKPTLTARIRQPLQLLALMVFFAFIIVMIVANWDLVLKYFTLLATLVIGHNALALATGYAIALLARENDYNRRAITIETGIQNSGLGLILIFGFFDGLGGMATIAALWGVWHIISGYTVASIWRLRPVAEISR